MLGLKKSKRRMNMIIKEHTIRYIISTPNERERISDFGEVFLPNDLIVEGVITDERKFIMQIEDILIDHKLKARDLYFCVPDASAIIRHHSLPDQINWDEIKGYLYSQLGETVHLPFEAPVFDFVKLGMADGEKHILFVAYPEERLEQLRSSFKEAKLIPKAADLSSLSTYRFYEEQNEVSEGEHNLMVEWNADGIMLTFFHDGIPQFSRQMKSTLDRNGWKVRSEGEKTWVRWEGELDSLRNYVREQLKEITKILSFYKFSVKEGEADISKVILSGDWCYRKELEEQLEDFLKIPVQWMKLSGLNVELPNHFVDAVGLSYKK
ncbi:hypothetical protein LF817_03820 [Halobacillus sp. A1]|uniref:type IV pilus biogenesis protein PilM n=1 Tax=Halobacillus sp. A1 TaxID=2880262 RepID=UPI0020A68EA7|nr:hypothetical protein [Halobacillus sp. A1]MCP3030461.1 hypothetical protein [Halobacillus sp. A1]